MALFKKGNDTSSGGDPGWLEIKLNKYEIKYCWDCIKASGKKHNVKPSLTGQINASYAVDDKDGMLMKKIINPAIKLWDETYSLPKYLHRRLCQQQLVLSSKDNENLQSVLLPNDVVGENSKHQLDYKLHSWWVNYQQATEYNPIHRHGGLFSFAIWLKEPTSFAKQKLKENAKNTNGSRNYVFDFHYLDKLGYLSGMSFPLGPEMEGMMLFFPADLNHSVNPFYDVDEARVSMAGNIVPRFTLKV